MVSTFSITSPHFWGKFEGVSQKPAISLKFKSFMLQEKYKSFEASQSVDGLLFSTSATGSDCPNYAAECFFLSVAC